jgi:hypothetical protein
MQPERQSNCYGKPLVARQQLLMHSANPDLINRIWTSISTYERINVWRLFIIDRKSIGVNPYTQLIVEWISFFSDKLE